MLPLLAHRITLYVCCLNASPSLIAAAPHHRIRAIDGALLETAPQTHTVHCLRDVQACRDNGYAFLEETPGGKYIYKYRLDAGGNTQVLAIIDASRSIDNFKCTATGTVDGETLVVSTMVEFDSGVPIVRRTPPAALWLHMLLMIWSWGTLLPWGAVLANRLRNPGSCKPGAWFRMHKKLQITGWVLQLLGFLSAVLYCQYYAAHFTQPHTYIGMAVVAAGTLQPLNALFRPHPPTGGWANDKKPFGRVVWELLHKGVGWGAIALGIVNIALGLQLAAKQGYAYSLVGVGSAFFVLGALPALLFLLFGLVTSPQPGGAGCLRVWGELQGNYESASKTLPE